MSSVSRADDSTSSSRTWLDLADKTRRQASALRAQDARDRRLRVADYFDRLAATCAAGSAEIAEG